MVRRTAIVTGSAHGIGKAIAFRLLQDGYSVCINDIPGAAADIDAVVAEMNTETASVEKKIDDARTDTDAPRVIGIPADVTSPDAVEAMVRETVEKLGPLTLMVANAGVCQTKPLLSVTESDIDKVFSVNLKGTFNCYTHAARQMIAQGDPQTVAGVNVYKIIGAASITALKGAGALGIYSASKWAVRGLTQAMAIEMAPHKITVNAYAPGIIGTAMWDEIDEKLGDMQGRAKGESMELYLQRIALGRLGAPEDVAGLVGGYLSSKDSDYTTGQTLLVDGGTTLT